MSMSELDGISVVRTVEVSATAGACRVTTMHGELVVSKDSVSITLTTTDVRELHALAGRYLTALRQARPRTRMGAKATGETREAVLARALAGESPKEIADALGLARASVYDHIKKLRKAGALPPKAEKL